MIVVQRDGIKIEQIGGESNGPKGWGREREGRERATISQVLRDSKTTWGFRRTFSIIWTLSSSSLARQLGPFVTASRTAILKASSPFRGQLIPKHRNSSHSVSSEDPFEFCTIEGGVGGTEKSIPAGRGWNEGISGYVCCCWWLCWSCLGENGGSWISRDISSARRLLSYVDIFRAMLLFCPKDIKLSPPKPPEEVTAGIETPLP